MKAASNKFVMPFVNCDFHTPIVLNLESSLQSDKSFENLCTLKFVGWLSEQYNHYGVLQ